MPPSDTLPTNYLQLCRLCAELIDGAHNSVPIYSPPSAEVSLDVCIATYLPIEIHSTDQLPLHICPKCSSTLLGFHSLHTRCQLQDAQWRRQLATASVCPFCSDHLAPTAEQLQLHFRHRHPDRVFHCDVCALLIDRRQLLAHMTGHAASWRPEEEEEATADTAETKNGEKETANSPSPSPPSPPPIECPQCQRPFGSHKALAAHSSHVHGGQRPFECPHCGDRFAYKRVRDNHVRAKHETERGLRCVHCERTFKTDTVLYAHCRRLHAGEKGGRSPQHWSGSCEQCGRTFGTRTEMVRHLATHSNAAPRWPCPYCSRRFATRDGRTKHLRTHTVMTREFRCRMCAYAGAQRRYLVAHMRNVHQTGLRGD